MIRQGTCKKCAKCCHTITIFIKRKYFRFLWVRKVLMKFAMPNFQFVEVDSDGDMLFSCVHFNGKGCTKYQDRPLLCRMYPTEEVYLNNRMIDGCGYHFID